jgi:hypothetical protein
MTTSEFNVSINLSTFQSNPVPSEGGVDASSVESIRNNLLATGTTFGSVSSGQVVLINNYPVTLTSTTVASVVSAINAQSAQHHAVAGTSGGNLTLINEELYTNLPVSVCDGTPGITAQLGFASPTLTAIALPSTLASSIAQKRANLRWNMIMARIGQTMTVNSIHGITLTGATYGVFPSNPTAISFNVVLDTDNPYAYDASGNLVYGPLAVQTAVATALTDSDTLVVDLYDPTSSGPTPPGIVNGMCADTVVVGALTSNIATALAAVTVTLVV